MRICVYISLFGLSVRLHCYYYYPVLLCLHLRLLPFHKNTRTVPALRLILASSLENWRYRKTRNVLTRNRRPLFLFHLFRGLSVAAAHPRTEGTIWSPKRDKERASKQSIVTLSRKKGQ